MKHRKIWFIISIIITVISLFLLITGSSLLTVVLIDTIQLPLGTITTWLGFIGISSSIYLSNKELRKPSNWIIQLLNFQLKLSLFLSFCWIIISYILAGNLSFSFSEKATFQGGQLAMRVFWILNYALVIIPIIVFFSFWILKSITFKHKQ